MALSQLPCLHGSNPWLKIAGAQAENRDFVGAKETFLLVEEMADTITDSRTKAGVLSSIAMDQLN